VEDPQVPGVEAVWAGRLQEAWMLRGGSACLEPWGHVAAPYLCLILCSHLLDPSCAWSHLEGTASLLLSLVAEDLGLTSPLCSRILW
jgi:hypothetical protein